MASTAPSIRPTTIVLATAGAAVAGFFAYALYFDHKRRTDPEFRKSLKRAAKAEAKASKVQKEQAGVERRKEVKAIVERVNEEGWPRDPEEVEKYFMDEVAEGELLCQDGMFSTQASMEKYFIDYAKAADDHGTGSKNMDAAACFFRALKVYPQPSDLISIYDRTVPKVLLMMTFALNGGNDG